MKKYISDWDIRFQNYFLQHDAFADVNDLIIRAPRLRAQLPLGNTLFTLIFLFGQSHCQIPAARHRL